MGLPFPLCSDKRRKAKKELKPGPGHQYFIIPKLPGGGGFKDLQCPRWWKWLQNDSEPPSAPRGNFRRSPAARIYTSALRLSEFGPAKLWGSERVLYVSGDAGTTFNPFFFSGRLFQDILEMPSVSKSQRIHSQQKLCQVRAKCRAWTTASVGNSKSANQQGQRSLCKSWPHIAGTDESILQNSTDSRSIQNSQTIEPLIYVFFSTKALTKGSLLEKKISQQLRHHVNAQGVANQFVTLYQTLRDRNSTKQKLMHLSQAPTYPEWIWKQSLRQLSLGPSADALWLFQGSWSFQGSHANEEVRDLWNTWTHVEHDDHVRKGVKVDVSLFFEAISDKTAVEHWNLEGRKPTSVQPHIFSRLHKSLHSTTW